MSAALGPALLLLASTPAASANSAHRLHHFHERKHVHRHVEPQPSIPVKRSKQCQFPTDDGDLVAITPGEKNAGWAMSPDQECLPGNYCPIACRSGMVMAQWDPDSKYEYPSSMVRTPGQSKADEVPDPLLEWWLVLRRGRPGQEAISKQALLR